MLLPTPPCWRPSSSLTLPPPPISFPLPRRCQVLFSCLWTGSGTVAAGSRRMLDPPSSITLPSLHNLPPRNCQVIFSGLRKGSDIEALLVAHGIELAWYIGGSGDASRRDGNRRGGDGGDTPARDGDSSGGGRGGARDGDVSLGGGFGGSAALGSFDLSDDDAVGSALAAPGCKVWSFGGLALAARFVEEALLRTARAGGLVHAQVWASWRGGGGHACVPVCALCGGGVAAHIMRRWAGPAYVIGATSVRPRNSNSNCVKVE
eukprot:356996-Chlamydomonas_euryale.AAC.1